MIEMIAEVSESVALEHGLTREEYQRVKRVRFRFHGSCNMNGTLHVVFVYNNRGLSIEGPSLSVVRV